MFSRVSHIIRRLLRTVETRNYFSYKDALEASRTDFEDAGIVAITEHATKQFIETTKSTYPKIASHLSYGMLSLLYCYQNRTEQNRTLTVLNPGGSCGIEYFISKSILGHMAPLRWHVVETPAMAQAGAKFANDELAFFSSEDIDKAQSSLNGINLIYMSGMLQYLEDPVAYLQKILTCKAEYFYIGRVFLSETERKPVYIVQRTSLFNRGYGDKWKCIPITVIPKSLFLDILTTDYDIIYEFDDNSGVVWNSSVKGKFGGGFLIKRKGS